MAAPKAPPKAEASAVPESKPSRRVLRHRDLFEKRDARLKQLLFATLLLGTLASFKVTHPSVALALDHQRLGTERTASAAELAALAPGKAQLAEVMGALAAARDAIKRAPWLATVETLKEGFATLRRAGEEQRRDPAAARRWYRERPERERLEGLEREGADLRPWEQRAPERRQQPTPEARPLDERPLDERPLDGRSLDEPAYAPLSIDANAAGRLDDAAFAKLFGETLDRAATELLERTVATILDAIEQAVRAPIERALAAATHLASDLGGVRQALDDLALRLAKWRTDHLAQREWLATPDQKRQEVEGLNGVIERWRQALEAELTPLQQQLEQRGAAAKERSDALAAQQEGIAARQQELTKKVADLLPAWIKNFVTVDELVRLLPFALVLLAGLIAVGAALTRHHHLASRAPLHPDPAERRDPALTSSWTLADRGLLGTLWTTLCWCAATAAWWWLTRDALQCAGAIWNSPAFPPASFSVEPLLALRHALWLGPLLLAVGIGAAWRDWQREQRAAAP
ncbi:MAG: hypothetical protein JNL90_02745 [Planctomycetes bacterium]|nr:hypothetical protein [Planctomycetota bacterium]